MASETKVSLLIAMGLILLIGIIITDHFSVAQQQTAPSFEPQSAVAVPQPTFGSPAQAGMNPHPHDVIDPHAGAQPQSNDPVPLPYELPGNDTHPLPHQGASPGSPTQPVQTPTTSINPGPVAQNNGYSHMQPLQQTVDTRRPQPIIHYVQEGESLWEIAERYYGDGNYWRTIAEANPNRIIPDGSGVRPGVRLILPNRAGLADPTGQGNPVVAERTAPPSPLSTGQRNVQRVSSSRTNANLRIVTVEPGETLSELASRHLGSANRWQELLDANRDQLSSATQLRSGMKLKVPLDQQVTVAQRPSPTPAPHQTVAGSNATQSQVYTVQAGDTLSSIASQHLGKETAWYDLFQANKSLLGGNPNNLKVGLQLRLPH